MSYTQFHAGYLGLKVSCEAATRAGGSSRRHWGQRSTSMLTASTRLPLDPAAGFHQGKCSERGHPRRKSSSFFFFFCLNTWMYFSWITKSPESRTRQIQVSFHLPHNTTDFFFFGSVVLNVSSLSPGLLPSDCRMTAERPAITPTFKTKRMGKGAPAASPLYQDRKSFPRKPQGIDGLL